MRYMIILAEYDDETDSVHYIETCETVKDYAAEAFKNAVAYVNSMEFNHDQTDRTEGSL